MSTSYFGLKERKSIDEIGRLCHTLLKVTCFLWNNCLKLLLQNFWNFIRILFEIYLKFYLNFGRQKVFWTSTQRLKSYNYNHSEDYFLFMRTNFKINNGIKQLLLAASHKLYRACHSNQQLFYKNCLIGNSDTLELG